MAVEKASLAASHQTRLQKIVLGWDYLRLLAQSKTKEKKRKKGEEGGTGSSATRSVPETFSDVKDYIAVFEPLLLEECCAQITRGEEEGGGLECHMAALTHWEKANEFYSLKLAIKAEIAVQFTDNDLLLLSKEQLGGTVLPTTYAFALVEGRESQQILRLRIYLNEESGNDGERRARNKTILKFRAALQGSASAWWITKLCNLSTISREFAGLFAMGSLPFVDVILSARPTDVTGLFHQATNHTPTLWNIPQPLMEHLKNTHNGSQLQAIQAGLSRQPMVLIQGPPGTGKTQTILGLLSVILHATPTRLPTKDGSLVVQARKELSLEEKMDNWLRASPWLGNSLNPRDLIMPLDGDDGFFPTTGNQYRPEVVGAKRKHRAHVLVCAPSNSALDEIVLRLITIGLRDEYGHVYTPSIVRVGVQAHHSIQSVCMDNLVEQRLNSMERSTVSRSGSAGAERDRIRVSVLEESAIVCSTLSFSGSSMFSRMKRGFDVVVIDEAAQAVEPATLVPLAHGCRQAFLVGDPIQLPATVLSTSAVKLGYGMSLFKRFQKAGYPVQMLKIQYRMHPEICYFPSKEFYAKELEDGDQVKDETTRPWHEHHCFGPFAFFDISGEESQPGSGSWVNTDEVDFILVLYRHMVGSYPELKGSTRIAIISPYRQQVKLLRERFNEVLGEDAARYIDINTVDGFQGREKDIAIFSCVRANKGKGIGFVSDYRRMNVGLTRARASMLVVGCADSLKQDNHWTNLIESAVKRQRLFKVEKPYEKLFSDESLAAMKNPEKKDEHDQLGGDISHNENIEADAIHSQIGTFDEGDAAEDNQHDGDMDATYTGYDDDED